MSVIAINIGTKYIRLGIWLENKVEIIINKNEERCTPFCINFGKDGRSFGSEAKSRIEMYPKSTICNVNRFLGRKFDDKDIHSDMRYLPFDIIEEHGKLYFQIENENEITELLPEQIYSMAIINMKELAEDYLNHEVTDAVVTIPANFNHSQRCAVLDAAKIAGLNVLQLISEPTAAAIYYSYKNNIKNKTVLIVDIGGGTFDASVITIDNGTFKVRATAGDTHLGGEDFDNALVEYFIKEIKEKYNKDITTNPDSLIRLKIACEEAKRKLSSINKTNIVIDYLFDEIYFKSPITRSQFESLCSNLFNKIKTIIESVIKDSKLNIDEIIFVGSSTRIPKIRDIISNIFDGKNINKTVNVDEAVINGAVILSGDILNKTKSYKVLDITPYSFNIVINGGNTKTIIKRHSIFPITKSLHFTISDTIKQKYLLVYLFRKLFCNKKVLTSIKIYEEELSLKNKPKMVNEYIIDSIISAPYIKRDININFDIDINGILSVSFSESNGIVFNKITSNVCSKRLNITDIDRMKLKEKMYKEKDKECKEIILSMDYLDQYASNLRRYLEDKNTLNKLISNYIECLSKDCETVINWVRDNNAASKEEYDNIKLGLEDRANKIMFNSNYVQVI